MNNSFVKPQIPDKLTNENKNYDDYICLIKFEYCDRKFPLEKLSNKQLKSLMTFLKKIEKCTWKHIKNEDKSLKYEIIDNPNQNIPKNVPMDARIISLRVSEKFRVIGFRSKENLYIIWFDKNHEVY